jgi:Ca2+-binding RTX toxin-like protein
MATFVLNAGQTFDSRDYGIGSYADGGTPGTTKLGIAPLIPPGPATISLNYWWDFNGDRVLNDADYYAGSITYDAPVNFIQPSDPGRYEEGFSGFADATFTDLRTGAVVGTLTNAYYEFTMGTFAWGPNGWAGPATEWQYSVVQNLPITPMGIFGGDDNVTLGDGNDYFLDQGGKLVIDANGGDDTILAYGDGIDEIDGGDGNDSIHYQNFGHTIRGGAGNDTIGSDGASGDSNLQTTFIGGSGDDYISGAGGGSRSLFIEETGSGNDTYIGAAALGNYDIVDYSAASAVTVDLSVGGPINGGANGVDTLIFIEEIRGSAFNDSITGSNANEFFFGNAGNDALKGGGGDDYLVGGLGNDTLIGGTGIDTADYYDSISAVTVKLGIVVSGFAKGSGGTATGDKLQGIENLSGSNFNDTLWGDNLDNRLYGAAGNDKLDGQAGADVMIGHTGADTYYVDNIGDTVIDTNEAGAIDTVVSSVDFTLGDYLENLTLAGTASISGFGNTAVNKITGNSVDNSLFGFAGNDTLLGGEGNDILTGGVGKDILTGGTGADHFCFDFVSESATVSTARDTITDFKTNGEADLIDLSGIADSLGLTLNFIGTGAFTGLGQVHCKQSGLSTLLEINSTGSLSPDFAVVLTNVTATSMTLADFILA